MKRFFENLAIILIVVAVAVGLIALFWFTSSGFRSMCTDIGQGNSLVGVLLFPFALIGGIDVFRGFFAVTQEDERRFTGDKNAGKLYVYILIRFLGYLALIFAISGIAN